MSIMEKTVRTLTEFEEEAARFAMSLSKCTAGATLVTLSGELGAGKTAFVKAVARAWGIREIVNSPTFVLEKIYLLDSGEPFERLVHIDAYRLESGESMKALGFDALMQDRRNVIMLEWPERVQDSLQEPTIRISIETHPDDSRTISYG
jgi:tRNA threonylcarbamoyladenosine biosynthesis protein TsaE